MEHGCIIKILKKTLENSPAVGHPPEGKQKHSVLGTLGTRAMLKEDTQNCLVYRSREMTLILVLFS